MGKGKAYVDVRQIGHDEAAPRTTKCPNGGLVAPVTTMAATLHRAALRPRCDDGVLERLFIADLLPTRNVPVRDE